MLNSSFIKLQGEAKMIIDEKQVKELFIKKYSKELAEKTKRTEQEILQDGLLFTDFKGNVSIIHEDGSTANYRYAFFIKTKDTYAVFTEHCGYHEFKKEWLEKIKETK
jgi:hypothetical protein